MTEPDDLGTTPLGDAEILDQSGQSTPAMQDGGGPTTSGSNRRRWPVVAGAAAVLVVGGAGIALGMALSGGGTQPEELMPADAVFYADVDFDPDAGQKVNLVRLLSKFPEVANELGDRGDIKAYLVDQLVSGDSEWTADEVTSWLGDRAGVGVYWDEAAGQPSIVFALAVTDEDAASAALGAHLDDDEWTIDQGFVVMVESPGLPGAGDEQSAADIVSQSDQASLADDPDFVAATQPLGAGIASVYVDGDRAQEVFRQLAPLGMGTGGMMGMTGNQLAGQVAAVVRVEPSAIELVARSTEVQASVATETTELMNTLPDGTVAAFAVGGGGQGIADQWDAFTSELDQLGQLGGMGMPSSPVYDDMQPASYPLTGTSTVNSASTEQGRQDAQSQFDRVIAELERQYNIRLPDDLVTLFGDDLVVAVDGDGLISASPSMGLRSVTDPTDAADLASRVQPVIDDVTAGFGIVVEPVDDGLVVATNREYADQLASGDGNLASDPGFQSALPDTANATAEAWIDIDAISGLADLFDSSSSQVLDPLQGLGVVAGTDDDGEFFRARLTFDESSDN
ncbi:MAG TPA: hypothetical protein VMT88_05105 [Actinomycetes bacterium]|nr:hypothetical protein [Actinomycetes bacterium]